MKLPRSLGILAIHETKSASDTDSNAIIGTKLKSVPLI